jgi:hypothetical protein
MMGDDLAREVDKLARLFRVPGPGSVNHLRSPGDVLLTLIIGSSEVGILHDPIRLVTQLELGKITPFLPQLA